MAEPVVVLREPDGLLTVQTTQLPLAEVFEYYREAYAVLLGARDGDPECRANVEAVVRLAREAPPGQRGRAVIMAHVMQIAMREIQAQPIAVQSPPPEPAPVAPQAHQAPRPPLRVVPPPGDVAMQSCGHPNDIACGCAPKSAEAS